MIFKIHKQSRCWSKQRKYQKGAGFIEVLVALVILAIGLLGVLSMQSRGLGSNQRAIFSSEVNMLAADMTDRILSFGIAGADSAEFDGVDVSAAQVFADPVVNQHVADWRALVNGSSLPSSVGTVVWTAATTSYLITIQWDDERSGVMNQDCNDNTRDANGNRNSLTCFQLTVNL
ncbi:type IV pilus modification protein PilV [Eionea flava]